MANFGENLKRILLDKGISQRAFAASMGMSPQAVNFWIRGSGTPKKEGIEKAAEILSVTIEELTGEPTFFQEAPSYSVLELRELLGMSRSDFCNKYKIPVQTVLGWEHGQSKCPEYVYELLKFRVEYDLKEGNDD